MNIIKSYLQKAVVSRCSQTKTAAFFFQMFISCAFSAPAGQVTQRNKWNALSGDTCFKSCSLRMSSCVSPSYVWGFLVFSHPLNFRLPPLSTRSLSFRTSVRHLQDRCLDEFSLPIILQIISSCHACIAKPTAWERGCGKCHSHFPTFKKECACFAMLLWALALEVPGS